MVIQWPIDNGESRLNLQSLKSRGNGHTGLLSIKESPINWNYKIRIFSFRYLTCCANTTILGQFRCIDVNKSMTQPIFTIGLEI